MPHPDLHHFRVCCKSVTIVTNDSIPVELDGGEHSLFYNSFPFDLNFNQSSGGTS